MRPVSSSSSFSWQHCAQPSHSASHSSRVEFRQRFAPELDVTHVPSRNRSRRSPAASADRSPAWQIASSTVGASLRAKRRSGVSSSRIASTGCRSAQAASGGTRSRSSLLIHEQIHVCHFDALVHDDVSHGRATPASFVSNDVTDQRMTPTAKIHRAICLRYARCANTSRDHAGATSSSSAMSSSRARSAPIDFQLLQACAFPTH